MSEWHVPRVGERADRQNARLLDDTAKRQHGAYYTEHNLFNLRPFVRWAEKAHIRESVVLEPFAGTNNLIRMLRDTGMCNAHASFDIDPQVRSITKRDTIRSFPRGYGVCVTNPPWLTNYSAGRRHVPFPDIKYDNIYKHCLELALENCDHVAFILPGTFLRTGLFRERLASIVFINHRLFTDTDNPVCLALLGKKRTKTRVYHDNRFVGVLENMEQDLQTMLNGGGGRVLFNQTDGDLGLFGVDNTREPSIRFCRGEDIRRTVKPSDRLITRIGVEFVSDIDDLVARLNDGLAKFRETTHDIFLAPFKGLRADGRYRRRLDYRTARGLIQRYG